MEEKPSSILVVQPPDDYIYCKASQLRSLFTYQIRESS